MFFINKKVGQSQTQCLCGFADFFYTKNGIFCPKKAQKVGQSKMTLLKKFQKLRKPA